MAAPSHRTPELQPENGISSIRRWHRLRRWTGEARALNGNGARVGSVYLAHQRPLDPRYAFINADGVSTLVEGLGGLQSIALGLNDSGTMLQLTHCLSLTGSKPTRDWRSHLLPRPRGSGERAERSWPLNAPHDLEWPTPAHAWRRAYAICLRSSVRRVAAGTPPCWPGSLKAQAPLWNRFNALDDQLSSPVRNCRLNRAQASSNP